MVFLSIWLSQCGKQLAFVLLIMAIPLQAQAGNINIAAGVPTKANDSNFCILERPQYFVSMSKDLNVAN